MRKRFMITLAMLLSLAAGTPASAAKKQYCGELTNGIGPFDYRTADAQIKYTVEMAHYTDEVEQGIKGNTGPIAGDLDYTLRAFPNHPRALTTVIKLATRYRNGQIPGQRRPSECYFERAVRFQPDDGAAWALFAQYLYAAGQGERAQPMLEKAAELSSDNPAINYNLGLVYAKQKQFDKALPFAQKAYAAGFPLPGLKQLLIAAHKWVEPPPAPEEPAKAEQTAAEPNQAPEEEAAKR